MENNIIGIYDRDYFSGRNFTSLEVMKIAAYWASKRKMVSITSDPNPELYSKFYYCSDFGDVDDIPNFSNYDNVTFIGHTFWSNYNHQLPPEIEATEPMPELYPDLAKYITLTTHEKWKPKYAAYVTRGLHFRWDGTEENKKEILDKASKVDFPSYFCYNYNIARMKDWENFIDELLEVKSSSWSKLAAPRVYFKFPVEVTNDTFYLLKKYGKNYLRTNMTWTFAEVLPLRRYRYVQEYWKRGSRLKRNQHTPQPLSETSGVPYIYCPTLHTNRTILSKYMKDFLFQCIETRNKSSCFLLKIDQDFFTDEGWLNFFEFLVDYANFDTISYYYGDEYKHIKEAHPEQFEGNVRYPRNITINEYLQWRFQDRIATKQKIKHRNIVSKMKLIMKTQPNTADLFRTKPKEVLKSDWTDWVPS